MLTPWHVDARLCTRQGVCGVDCSASIPLLFMGGQPSIERSPASCLKGTCSVVNLRQGQLPHQAILMPLAACINGPDESLVCSQGLVSL